MYIYVLIWIRNYIFDCNFIGPKCHWFHHLSSQYFPKFLTCLCGRVVSKSHLPTLILTCLWTSGRVLTKALLIKCLDNIHDVSIVKWVAIDTNENRAIIFYLWAQLSAAAILETKKRCHSWFWQKACRSLSWKPLKMGKICSVWFGINKDILDRKS